MRLKIICFVTFVALFVSGCANKQTETTNATPPQQEVKTYQPQPFKQRPIIGSRNNDARTVVDMGTLLKIWVAPYKSRSGVLVASHDIYAWAKLPDFVVGEEIPVGKTVDNGSGMIFNNKLPLSMSSDEVDRSDLKNDKNIQEFINGFRAFAEKNLQKGEDDKPVKNSPDREDLAKQVRENMNKELEKGGLKSGNLDKPVVEQKMESDNTILNFIKNEKTGAN